MKRLFKSALTSLLIGLLLLGQGAQFDAQARSARGVESLPLAAIAAGYTTRTYGPAVTLNTNIFNYNFNGITPIGGQSVQNGDGSISLPITDGSGFGAGISTAKSLGGSSWQGIMFAGGWYAEAVIRFTATNTGGGFPFPAWWMLDQGFLTGNVLQWPGQAVGFQHRIEFDIMQWPHNTALFWVGPEINDWFGSSSSTSIQSVSSPAVTNTTGAFSCTIPGGHTLTVGAYVTINGPLPTYPAAGGISGYTNPSYYKISATNGTTTFTLTQLNGSAITTAVGSLSGIAFVQVNSTILPDPHVGVGIKVSQNAAIPVSLSDYNRYGVLYLPATAITPGTVTTFFNGVPVPYAAGNAQMSWTLYSSGDPPPPQYGTSAASLTDQSIMMFIFGTDVTSPMDIATFSVYQKPVNGNVVHP